MCIWIKVFFFSSQSRKLGGILIICVWEKYPLANIWKIFLSGLTNWLVEKILLAKFSKWTEKFRWFLRNKNYRWFFKTFSERSLPSFVSKKTIKKIGHQPRKRANLAPFMPVLVLITRVIHRSTSHFAVAGSTVYQSYTWENWTWQGESLEHMEQYHIKFAEKSHQLFPMRRDSKTANNIFIYFFLL